MDAKENGIFLCKSLDDIRKKAEYLFEQGKESLSICPFYNIKKEYRCFYLNGEVLLIYGKEKPYVIGNGKDTVKKLVRLKDVITEDVDMNYIPLKDEKVYVSWKHNLYGGATPEILNKGELYSKIENIAIMGAKAINITFATVDVIQTEDDNLYIIEINSGVATTKFSEQVEDGYEIAKEIYKKALLLEFGEEF